MPSMSNVFGLLEKIESSNLAVNQSRCVLVRNRNAGCARCALACATGSISIQDNELAISPEKCIGCGTCASVCPTGALEAKMPTDAELHNQGIVSAQKAEGEVIMACRKLLDAASGLYDPEKIVGVACLGRINESIILSLIAIGRASQVTLVHGKCDECQLACGSHEAEKTCKTANMLLEAWRSPVKVRFTAKLPAKTRLVQAAEYDHGRREFFSDLKDGARMAATTSANYAVKDALGLEDPEAPSLPKVDERGVLPQDFPARRKRLLNALDELGNPENVLLTTHLWGTIDIDTELCSSCRMCATFCPTGAIFKFSTKKGKIGVKHRPRQCVNCGCCEAVCRKGALKLSSTVSSSVIMSADVNRFVLPPIAIEPNKPQSIVNSMRKLIDCEHIYDR